MPATVHWTVADGMTILGLPRKPVNANTRPHYFGSEVSFLYVGNNLRVVPLYAVYDFAVIAKRRREQAPALHRHCEGRSDVAIS